MANTADLKEEFAIDSWVGNPDMITAAEPDQETPAPPTRFHSLNLTKRIFFSALVAISIFLIGVVIVFQSQNKSVQLLRTSLLAQADFFEAKLEVVDTETLDIGSAARELLDHNFYKFSVFDSFGKVLYQNTFNDGQSAMAPTDGWFRLKKLTALGASTRASLNDVMTLTLNRTLRGDQTVQTYEIYGDNVVFATGRAIEIENQTAAYLVIATNEQVIAELGAIKIQSLLIFLAVALSLALILSTITARSITVPLNDLARAAEIGKSANISAIEAERLLIPNISARRDVVGRLAKAMREMTQGLYSRIETNETFAADVAHEIKNPLASMQSAVDSLRIAKDKKSRNALLNILAKDVMRLDRLVSDIANASRLDSELVTEEMQEFEFTSMLQNIIEFLRINAEKRKIQVFFEPPTKPIKFAGLEERLAQVFVNLITNAISFTNEGDAIRVWTRLRDNRILAVVEDTGPGIPEYALESIFGRFYSQREDHEFGTHSGLGLAISKQIVEAHGGTIWAENIRNTDINDGKTVLGARFVVALPA
ncbi:MAG: HAMP domain-containing sensor histidine kinase [Pseudomonadota bacterium]